MGMTLGRHWGKPSPCTTDLLSLKPELHVADRDDCDATVIRRDATRDATRDPVGDAVRDAVRDAARDAVFYHTGDAVRDAVRDPVGDAVRDAVRDAVDNMSTLKPELRDADPTIVMRRVMRPVIRRVIPWVMRFVMQCVTRGRCGA